MWKCFHHKLPLVRILYYKLAAYDSPRLKQSVKQLVNPAFQLAASVLLRRTQESNTEVIKIVSGAEWVWD